MTLAPNQPGSELRASPSLPKVIHYTSIPASAGRVLGFSDHELGEFDDDQDLLHIEQAVRDLGVEPIRLGWGGRLVRQLVDEPPPLLWNLNSGVLGGTRTAQVAGLCEMLAIPLVGSGAWTASLVQDKSATLSYVSSLAPEISLPKGVFVASGDDLPQLATAPFDGPYVLKPNNDESSRGLLLLDANHRWLEVVDRISLGLRAWGPVRLEQFVTGLDVSANAAVDAVGRLVPLEPIVVDHGASVYGGPQKARMSHRARPLEAIHPSLAEHVRTSVATLCRILGFRHYARFDFRCDLEAGTAVFLEANYCPSFEPKDDFAASALATGVNYGELIKRILSAAEADRSSSAWFHGLPDPVRRAWTSDALAALVRTN